MHTLVTGTTSSMNIVKKITPSNGEKIFEYLFFIIFEVGVLVLYYIWC